MTRPSGDTPTLTETYTEAEKRFDRRRRTIGLVLGPLTFLVFLAIPMPGLSVEAHRLHALMGFVVVYWVTEAIPLPATALAGPILAILLRIGPPRQVLAPFADPIIFLFMGGFMLAEAMKAHGLDRSIAFRALSMRWIGRSPVRVLVVFGGVATVLSGWLSNTATAAMLFPIAMSIVGGIASGKSDDRSVRAFALALMLVTAFGASIGGMATLVGSPPNLIGVGVFERATGMHITFVGWMIVGVPVALVMFVILTTYFRVVGLRGSQLVLGQTELAAEELRRLGPISRAQRNVMVALTLTFGLWLLPGALTVLGLGNSWFMEAFEASVPEAAAAMIGALLLFVLPVDWPSRRFTLTWEQAVRIDWGIIMLFGGGLAMGDLMFSTGLAEAMGNFILTYIPAHTTLVLTMIFTAVAIVITETASNTASASVIVPIAIAVSQAAGVPPIYPVLGATLGASMAFMMPVSTPPNAIAYSSGYVPITAMIRHGFVLDLFGYVVVVGLVMALGSFVA
jgi:sodium-dependent dicarboxylate transporter 2/3/5